MLLMIDFLFFGLMYAGTASSHTAALLAAVPLFAAVRYWVATGRTIIMDSEGCTIQFLWYRKCYTWDQLKTKRFADYKHSLGYKASYIAGAEFSPNMVRKPKWLKPVEYCALIHPVSFFFVTFKPADDLLKNARQYPSTTQFPCIYMVDEMAFRDKMKEWNIQLQED